MTVSIRRAGADDVDFLVELVTHEDVEPFLAAMRSKGRDEILDGDRPLGGRARGVRRLRDRGRRRACGHDALRAREQAKPDRRSRRARRPSRLPRGKVADAAARLFQRHLFDDLGFHRVQLEIYGFNERAMRHAERAGFTREGVRRKAYWRNDEWVDGVLYGLVAEDLEDELVLAVRGRLSDRA